MKRIVPFFLAMVFVISTQAQTIPTPTQTDEIIIDNGTSGQADPNDRIRYKVTIQNTGGSDALGTQLNIVPDPRTTFVPGSFRSSPLALNDAYDCTGNVGINVPAVIGLKANDFDDDIAGATITSGLFPTTEGGSINIAPDGGFQYTPPAGFTGSDTYVYTLNDGNGVGGDVPASDMATVTFTVNNLIWFIDNSGAAGDGRLNTPFNSLVAFNSSSASAGNVIYIEHTGTNYTGGIVLQNNEQLYGEGHTGSTNLSGVLPFTLAPNSFVLPNINGSRPVLVNSGGDGIQLASGNTVRGLNIGNCSAFGIDDNGNVGSLTISEVNITNGTGGGFRAANNGTLAVTLGSLSSTGGTNGLRLNNCSGSFSVGGTTSVTNSTDIGVNITSNTATVTFNALNISNSSTNQKGLLASGGTVNTTSGTINAGTGTAVDIDNTALGMVLTSVSSNGGAMPGIDLNSTTGSFSVTGVASTDGSGGTIQNKTSNGAVFLNATNISLRNFNFLNCASTDGPGPCGNSFIGNSGCHASIYLSGANNVLFDNIQTQNGQYGINGINVTDFDLLNSFIDNHGDGVDEDGIRFVNLLGTVNIKGNIIEDSRHNNIFIYNTVSTALNISIGGPIAAEQNTIRRAGKNISGQGSDGVLIEGTNGSNITADITNNIFHTSNGDHIQVSASNNSVWDITIDNNTMNTSPNVLGSGISLSCSGNWNGQLDYIISNNLLNDSKAAAINVNLGTTTLNGGTGTYTGSIINNTIAGDGPAITVTANGGGTLNAILQQNEINRFDADYAIRVLARDGSPTINTTINSNSINTASTTSPFNGLLVQAGAASGDGGIICANITNNILLNSGNNSSASSTDFRLRQRFNTTINLPGYVGGNTNTAAVVSFVQSQGNTGSGSATVDTNGFTGAGTACN